MSESRRSSRLKSRSANISSRPTSTSPDDEQSASLILTDNNTAITDMSENKSSSSEEDNEADSDYEEPSQARKGKKRKSKAAKLVKQPKRARSSGTTSDRVREVAITGTKKDQEHYLEVLKDFEVTELFHILSTSEDVSIEELIREWLDIYKENRDKFMQEFINLLLCCCGAIARVEEHDIHSNESSNETISELQMIFQQQKIHEFHLLVSKTNNKKTKYKFLYNNFVEFMSKLMDIANDMQLLYSESEDDESEITPGHFVMDLLTWLSSLSVCKIRCLRYVSTLSLYLFQDSLTEHVVNIEKNFLSKLTKQLAQEQKKKRPNEKTIEKLENTIEELQGNKAVTEGIIDNIVKLCFVHRFKDVDESIRSESMLHLSVWIKNYPEYFLKVTFLKYFGWLLSDTSVNVRQQVLKILPQLISTPNKKVLDNSAVRQFFERFKERILDIALKDIDLGVRLNAVNVLVEVASLGYLEDSEVLAISSLIFFDRNVKVSSHSKNSRFLASVAKFFARITIEKNEEFTDNYTLPETAFGLKTESLVKIGVLTRLLSKSLAYHLHESADVGTDEKLMNITQAAKFLYPYYGTLIEDLCKLLTYDGNLDYSFLALENEDDETSVREEFILPNDTESIVLYATVLNGLCDGGSTQSGQPRFRVAESVLPYIEKLLSQLPIHLPNVLAPILSIFNIFSFEDWIHTGYEKSIPKITEKIIKIFSESSITDENKDVKYRIFSETVKNVRELNLNELNGMWLNFISHIQLQMKKFLQEKMDPNDYNIDFNEVIGTLYGMYINKLVLLGKEYTIQFDSSLLQLFLTNYISRIPSLFESCYKDTIAMMNFKILTLLVTWQLQKWTEIIKNSIESEEQVLVPTDMVNSIAAIIERLNTTLISINSNDGASSDLSSDSFVKLNISNALIDIVSTLKIFEISLPEKEHSWSEHISDNFPYFIHERTYKILSHLFLYLEGLCAKDIGIELDRLANEDVNLNDIIDDNLFENNESELLLFTIKLKGLMKLDLLNDDISERISLNKEKFGSLFASIVDDTIFERVTDNMQLQPSKVPIDAAPKATLLSSAGNEELDPIEEQTQETDDSVKDIEMLDNDPVENSEI